MASKKSLFSSLPFSSLLSFLSSILFLVDDLRSQISNLRDEAGWLFKWLLLLPPRLMSCFLPANMQLLSQTLGLFNTNNIYNATQTTTTKTKYNTTRYSGNLQLFLYSWLIIQTSRQLELKFVTSNFESFYSLARFFFSFFFLSTIFETFYQLSLLNISQFS